MAFHNPNPKMRAIEQRNARSRAALFRELLRKGLATLRKTVVRR